MKKVAVVICNYNKQDYILKCIESLKESSYNDYDIFVVDNASTDDSVKLIKSKYGESLNLIVNSENKGGSGGFNTGMNYVINKGYKYIYLLDNDVIIHKNSLEYLVEAMEQDDNIGIVGSKIFFMDNPKMIQEFGSFIDFRTFNMKLLKRGQIEEKDVTEIIECDYVPACSALVRVDALKKVGVFNEEYFVYWDDIDFGYRLKLNGYKVIADSKSKVYHKGGGNVRTNTFGTYYFWRNRINFFLKYCDDKEIHRFINFLFDEIMNIVYSCNYSGKYSSAKTILMALDDAINGVSGKCNDDRILKIESNINKFEEVFSKEKHVCIHCNDNMKQVNAFIDRLLHVNEDINISLIGMNDFKTNKDVKIINSIDERDINTLEVVLCSHILKLQKIEEKYTYVDEYYNIMYDSEDKNYIKHYKDYYNINKNILYPIILNKAKNLKKRLSF